MARTKAISMLQEAGAKGDLAEFERDTLTDRVQDNLMELAKDGRWLGGRAPTGFKSEKLTTGVGKNKNTITYLTGVEEETAIVKKIYETLLKTRSIHRTATIISEEYKTKNGAEFTALAVRDIVKNPIYCTADERAYNYFLDKGGNIFGEFTEFTGKTVSRCIIELISIRSKTTIRPSSIRSFLR